MEKVIFFPPLFRKKKIIIIIIIIIKIKATSAPAGTTASNILNGIVKSARHIFAKSASLNTLLVLIGYVSPQMCSRHNKEIEDFCEQCDELICMRCLMFE